MQTPSPLGQYAPLVAAVVAVLLIAGYVIAVLAPGLDPNAASQLEPLAVVALGAVLGSAVAVNGYRAPLTALWAKLDTMQAKLAAVAAIPPDHPDPGAAIVAAVADPSSSLGPLPAQDGAPPA